MYRLVHRPTHPETEQVEEGQSRRMSGLLAHHIQFFSSPMLSRTQNNGSQIVFTTTGTQIAFADSQATWVQFVVTLHMFLPDGISIQPLLDPLRVLSSNLLFVQPKIHLRESQVGVITAFF